MEIGEIFAVNKSDRPIAKRFADDLRSMLELKEPEHGWRPPVIGTVGTTGEGLNELVRAIDTHREFLESNGLVEAKRIEALRSRLTRIAEEKLKEFFWENEYIEKSFESTLSDVISGKISPYEAANRLVTPVKREIEKAKGDSR